MTHAVASQPHSEWITPEKQLEALYSSLAEKIKFVAPIITELAIVIAQYGLDEAATNWYEVLARVAKIRPMAIPKTIPPLPADILQTLNSRCPIYRDQTKPDGTPYTIKDTHVLLLYPKEFGTVDHFLSEIVGPYSQVNNEELIPSSALTFPYGSAYKYADIVPEDTHWGLTTIDLLPESCDKTWRQQVALVNALSKRTLATYNILSLRQCCVAYASYKIATGEKLYVTRNKCEKGEVYTRVKETTLCANLGFGVRNKQPTVFVRPKVGIAAIWIVEENSAKKMEGCCFVS